MADKYFTAVTARPNPMRHAMQHGRAIRWNNKKNTRCRALCVALVISPFLNSTLQPWEPDHPRACPECRKITEGGTDA